VGRQIGFRLTVVDLEVLDERLQSHDGVVLVQPQPTPDLVISPTQETVRSSWPVGEFSLQFFARREDIPAVFTHHVPTQDQWLVSQTRSPVVEFFLMEDHRTSGAVAGGRFYFSTTFTDGTSITLVKHRAEFVRWADSLLSWARRTWTKGDDGVYLSPSAARV
jgi:hypothetical protein